MQTQTSTTRRKAKGRIDGDGQDAVIKMGPIRDAVDDAVNLFQVQLSAGEQFNEAIKEMAEKSGLLASVVRKYVVAKAGEKFEDKKREVDQLSLIFDDTPPAGPHAVT